MLDHLKAHPGWPALVDQHVAVINDFSHAYLSCLSSEIKQKLAFCELQCIWVSSAEVFLPRCLQSTVSPPCERETAGCPVSTRRPVFLCGSCRCLDPEPAYVMVKNSTLLAPGQDRHRKVPAPRVHGTLCGGNRSVLCWRKQSL